MAEKNIAQISLNLTDMDVNISLFFSVYINYQISNSSNHMHYSAHRYGCKYLSLQSGNQFKSTSSVEKQATQVTPMHVAYEEAKKDAAEIGVAVTGSELVGCLMVENL